MLGACIAIFAALEFFVATMATVAIAVVVTIMLGVVLAEADK